MQNRDIAVLLYNQRKLKKARENHRILLSGKPDKLKCPGGKVRLIDINACVILEFIAASITPHQYRMSNGKFKKGCCINAKPGTIHLIKDGPKLSGNWYGGEGAFRYLERGSNHTTIETLRRYGSVPVVSKRISTKKPHRVSFRGNIKGLPHDHPESRLVRQYVKYMGDQERFKQDKYPGNLRCDLFDVKQSRLIEAKMDTSRETIRMAYGQLCDYRRFYKKPQHKRRPRVAILLPKKPKKQVMLFLLDNKTLIIWKRQRRTLNFTDSSGGHWTKP